MVEGETWKEGIAIIPGVATSTMFKFIEDIRQVLIEQRRELSMRNATSCMWINIIKGAKTVNHTDTL